MIQLTDNFNSFNYKDTKYIEIIKNKRAIKDNLYITLKNYKEHKNKFIFFESDDSNDDLIITVKNTRIDGEDKYTAQTGNYIGRFTWQVDKKTVDIDIKSRFSDIFLRRMLNFANNVFLDVSVFKAQDKNTKDTDYSKFIIYYMFIQKLEKAFLLGLPKSYISVNHHEMKVKGKIDINTFIKYDIPFKGKISSTSREQKEIQEIIDVLYKAISIIDKQVKESNVISTKNIAHIKTHLKQHKSNRYVSNETISKAIKSKALKNPIFSPYKEVLKYAKLIINANNLEEKKDADKETFGFLVNVAELFEIYFVKLLQHRMPDWEVTHDRENKLFVYENQFYSRHMYPDIVMKKDNKVMVFDAKYKKMEFKSGIGDGKIGDLDRSDFFQINTYMTYYEKKRYEVIAGGLLYPIEKEFDCRFNEENCEEDYKKLKAHSDNWFGDSKTKFIVDGIDLFGINSDSKISDIKVKEDNFIKRIKQISGEHS